MNKVEILNGLKFRLASSGKAKSIDANGNVMYVDCDIYEDFILC